MRTRVEAAAYQPSGAQTLTHSFCFCEFEQIVLWSLVFVHQESIDNITQVVVVFWSRKRFYGNTF